MKSVKELTAKAAAFFLAFTVICGVLYTGVVTAFAQVLFPYQANGSIIEVDGKKYGSALLGQQYTGEEYLWGRIMNVDVSTYQDAEGNAVLYAAPSNLSPASPEYEALVQERVAKLQAAHPEKQGQPVPVELVTCSGSGLDPHISPAAAEYQVARISKARGISEAQVREVLAQCTDKPFLGIFGEEVVNVLKVNLTLDGIL